MTEQDAERKLDFYQSIHYDQDVIDIYFDVDSWEGDLFCREGSQAFYRGANITSLVDWEKVNEEINWKLVKEEAQDDY